jgi:5-methyltetrahydrofolate--homocysteine methyltransferase
VHDIGKNLVDIILTNNGYEVVNLGIKIGINEMVNAVEEHKADAIGMSGLLVKSTLIMRENLVELNDRSLSDIPVLLGGAALTRTYVERDLREVYDGRLFYGRDAFEGLRTMDRLVELKKKGEDDPLFGREISEKNVPRRSRLDEQETSPVEGQPARADVASDNPLYTPPFVGSRIAVGIPIDDVAEYLNLTALFRNQWGFRPENGENDTEFKERVKATLREQLGKAKEADLLVPSVAYGHFAANAEGNDLVIWKDESRTSEWMRFAFPRQRKEPWLCIADFFRPTGSGDEDFASFMLCTIGARAS